MKFTNKNILIIWLFYTLIHILVCPVVIRLILDGILFPGITGTANYSINNTVLYCVCVLVYLFDLMIVPFAIYGISNFFNVVHESLYFNLNDIYDSSNDGAVLPADGFPPNH